MKIKDALVLMEQEKQPIMRNTPHAELTLTIVLSLMLLLGIIIGAFGQRNIDRSEAVQQGYAHYSSTNGVWQWNINTNK